MNQPPQVGRTLRSRYKIVELLGSGGFGNTYLARDSDLPGQPECVVKHLNPKTPNPAVLPIAKNLFKREAQVLYRLGNTFNQIPRLFAHFEENGEFYLVQEFIDGHELTQEIIPGSPWSENAASKLLQEILEVLVVVHEHKAIHRDIKPQNLMRRKNGKIVLIDFGAVEEIDNPRVDAQWQISKTVAVGSPGYMPSEQLNGYPKLCSDVYAVGMIGIQALTGVHCHKLKRDPDTHELIWHKQARISNALADVLTTMVRYDFTQRYQSAAAALQALISIGVSPPLPSSDSFTAPPIEFQSRPSPISIPSQLTTTSLLAPTQQSNPTQLTVPYVLPGSC